LVQVIDHFDETTGFSAMERCTGWAAAVVAQMMARGQTPRSAAGVETQVPAGPYVAELRRHGVEVTEQVTVF
jgi:lysine 6-dehydrogenase